ncbi:3-oxoadipate enol-lactonase [soil metagenome]
MSVTLAHRVDGPATAPVVVLGPSLGTTWEMWDGLTDALAPRFRVVRYDTAGHGRSPVPSAPYDVADLAEDVLSLVTSLGVDRFAFVGLSLGGAVGQTLAASGRVTSLVLCCTVPVFGTADAWHERAATVRADGMGAVTGASLGRWFTDSFRASEPEEVARFAAMLDGIDPQGYAACCEALARFDATDRLGAIDVPTRVVAGADDPVCPPDPCRAMATAIPDADLVVLDASHLASAEQPGPFHAAVLEHLEKSL